MTVGEASAFRAPFLAATRAWCVKGDERLISMSVEGVGRDRVSGQELNWASPELRH